MSMKSKDKKLYFKLFISTFMISALTFGGGYVIVPLMRRRFVDELKWLSEDDMLDLVAIGTSAPGPIAVNTAVLLGHRLFGTPGALLAALGTVLPPVLINTAVVLVYNQIKGNPVVDAVFKGFQIGLAAIITDVLLKYLKNILKEKSVVQMLIIPAAFAAVYFFKINIIAVLLFSGIVGIIYNIIYLRKTKE